MPTVNFQSVPNGATTAQLADIVAKQFKELQFLMNNIDSKNVRNIAGFNVDDFLFRHVSGIVGMSGADISDPSAIRLWSGDADMSIAPWRVLQNGFMYSTRGFIGGWDIDEDRLSGTGTIEGGTIIGSEIMTALAGVYPRSVMSATNNLFSAEVSSGYGVYIVPDYSLTTPAILFNESGATKAIITLGTSPLSFAITTTGTTDISIQSAKDLILSSGGLVKFDSWNKIYSIGNTQTLQQALDAISSSIPSGDYAVVTYSGGVPTSGRALLASDIPNIAKSQVTNLVTDLAGKASKNQPSWNAPALQNSWANYGGTEATVGYRLDGVGNVRIKGMIRNGTTTIGTVIFNLPAGYRPLEDLQIATGSSNGSYVAACLKIKSNGDVCIESAANTWLTLSGLSFPAEQ